MSLRIGNFRETVANFIRITQKDGYSDDADMQLTMMQYFYEKERGQMMGFRFRKSISAGPLRINFSKSGVGASVGGKGFRYTKKAGGGTRSTVSIPGTGISYVKDYSSKSSSKRGSQTKNHKHNDTPKSTNNESNSLIELLLCIFLGWMGAHRFYTHRKVSGLVYLFTLGCCGIGWLGDILIIVSRFFPNQNASIKRYIKPIAYVLAFLILLLIGGCNSEVSDVPTEPTAIVETTEATTEPETTAPTTEPTTVPTTEATTEPATEPTMESTVTSTSEPATEAPTEPATEAPTEPVTEAPTEPATEAPTEPEPQGNMVWISKTGKKYHSNPNCSNMKNPSQITEEQAIARKLERCKKCY